MNPPVPEKTTNVDKNQSNDKSHIKRARCEFCDKLFNVRYMVRHMRVHTGEKPYDCGVCGKSFAVNENLITHMRKHTGERPFHCEFCVKSFTTNGNLATHMRLHTGERPYKCEVCGNVFNTKPNLDTHMRTHTGERPYQCEICSKAFSHRSHLVKHMKTHIREYVGSISQKHDKRGNSNEIKGSPTNDVKLEKVIKKCVGCGKKFESDKGLARHKCTKEASLICKLCRKTFKTAESLDGHSCTESLACNSHCILCGKTFELDVNLASHVCNEHTSQNNQTCTELTKTVTTSICTEQEESSLKVCGTVSESREELNNHKFEASTS